MSDSPNSAHGDRAFEKAKVRPARNLVTRADGKMVNVARKTGQLFVCSDGCCCGHTDKGFPYLPRELLHSEWERRRLRNKVHLTTGGCLGPCPLANVAMLLFDGRAIWLHSLSSDAQVMALYDYIEAMLEAGRYLPTPAALVDSHFDAFNWEQRQSDPAFHQPLGVAAFAQDPDGFLYLTQADTDLLALSKVQPTLESDFPRVRAFNISHLLLDEDIDAFLTTNLPGAEVVIVRLHRVEAFRRGLDRLVEWARENDRFLICLPGTDAIDPELTAMSTVGVPVAHEAFAYLQLGGIANYRNCLRFLSDHLLTTGFGYERPEVQPRTGIYHPALSTGAEPNMAAWRAIANPGWPSLAVLFYRSHLLSGNTDFIDEFVRQGDVLGVNILPVYAYSLKDFAEDAPAAGALRLPSALAILMEEGKLAVDAIVCTMSFAMGEAATGDAGSGDWSTAVLETLDVPIFQAMTASSSSEQWRLSNRGLSPLDTAMNVAIPEFDGRIITVPISFKEEAPLECDSGCTHQSCGRDTSGSMVVSYRPVPDRVRRVIGLAQRHITLRRKPNGEKRIAFVLTNYTAKASRIANAVGLDAPASLLGLLETMRDAGYAFRDLPADSDTLLHTLVERGSYDREVLTSEQMDTAVARVPGRRYAAWFAELPRRNREEMAAKWDAPPGRFYVNDAGELALAGIELGNAFVAVQPPRGYGMDPAAIYHMPDLPPPHPYHALYRWLGSEVADGGWGADAIVHIGKHGTLEWLPGKGIGASAECYPDLFLEDLPLIYPFIINNPGEGAQAKRRTHAVIVDHLTPPMTTAEGYGELEELARLVDEYYQLEQLDPTKLPLLQQQIWALIQQAKLDSDLGQLLNWDSSGDPEATHTHEWDPQFHEDGVPYTISDLSGRDFAHLVENINGYICELTSAQIRDGLHILGQPPRGQQLVETLVALTRLPNLDVPSLRAGVANALNIDLDAVFADLGARIEVAPAVVTLAGRPLPTHADVLEAIDALCTRLIQSLLESSANPGDIDEIIAKILPSPSHSVRTILPSPSRSDGEGSGVRSTLRFVATTLAPALAQTTNELTSILHALDGGYVAAGPSGAPTRGMAHVLPTGRNFYTVDPRALPSSSAWTVGRQLADGVIERHLRDEGRLPESVGISIWGTSAMRTQGDDIAEVFAFLGVRPVWQQESRRVVGLQVIPLEELGRPRIDVVCRISGFFRDAFPHLISLMDEAFNRVAALDEPLDQNFVRRHQIEERARLVEAGHSPAAAAERAAYRIFGCKPGSYGAGILPLIDEGNWREDADFAEAYINWGGYAYTATNEGVDARGSFATALSGVSVAVKNQDNREHDIFDSDDYLQYHGGMIATIRSLTGKNPRRYFGDSADPARTKVRDLSEEALRVFRSRVVNPKWIDGIKRHGYKGALELAATVDYLFGYDATAGVMEDWMYAKVAETYALDPAMRDFFAQSNPWALRDISARLVEAAERGLWSEPGDLADALRQTYLDTESLLEEQQEQSPLSLPVVRP